MRTSIHRLVLTGLLGLAVSLPLSQEWVRADGKPKYGATKNGANPNVSARTALHVPDLDGHDTTPLVGNKRRATVLFFITNDCPIANSYAPEIQRIAHAYASQQFGFYLVYVDPALSAAAARKHRQEYGYTITALLDHAQVLAKRTGATVTPEAAVVSPTGKVLYRGRIDDRYLDFGKSRVEPTTRDLRLALDALAQHKSVPQPTTRAIGCFIPPLK